MKSPNNRYSRAALLLFFAAITGSVGAGQIADPDFDAAVKNPAFTEAQPRALFDEGHNNFHKAAGSYKPFLDLITNDGARVDVNQASITSDKLKDYSLLIIVSVKGPDEDVSASPFLESELSAISAWVQHGGSLLLVTDHYPQGRAATKLGEQFGVDMQGMWTFDEQHHEKTGNRGWLVFSENNGLLGEHSILKGRNDAERIRSVTTFSGQSIKGKSEAVKPLLMLSDDAVDVVVEGKEWASAAGRAQAAAVEFGQGRVVVLGEAAMITAQYVDYPGEKPFRTGMTFPGSDNRQLALNIVRWLGRVFD